MKNSVLLVTLLMLFIVGHLKGRYHWILLKQMNSDLRMFGSQGDFRDSIDMKNPSQFWKYFSVTNILMFPAFLIGQKELDRSVVKKVRILSFIFILCIVVLILIVLDIVKLP